MGEFDFEYWQSRIREWYRNRMGEEFPLLQFSDLPQGIVERNPILSQAFALANVYWGIDFASVRNFLDRAAQELGKNGKFKETFDSSTLDELVDQLRENQQQSDAVDMELVEYGRQFPGSTMFILPRFYSINGQIHPQMLAALIAHEGIHIVQKEKGLFDKHPLSREGVAYAIQVAYMVQHLTPEKIKADLKKILLPVHAGAEDTTRLEAYLKTSEIGQTAALRFLGYDPRNPRQLNLMHLNRLLEFANSEAIETRTAYGLLQSLVA